MKSKYLKNMLNQYIVTDIETTGLSKYRHCVTEIAAIRVKNNEIIDEFQTLINPEKKIPKFITKLTGISDEMVKDAPKIYEVMPDFIKFIGNDILVAHNASFDYGFLEYNAKIHAQHNMENQKICTIKLARRLVPNAGSRKLLSLCEYFNITNETAHRAMSDVLATKELFQKLHNQLLKAGVEQQKDILRFESLPRALCEKLYLNNTNSKTS